MPMNLYAIAAAVALLTVAVAEILISRQKLQMKRQFLDELEKKEERDAEKDTVGAEIK
jgi:hypothetical protein